MTRFDVIVVGAGSVGVPAALSLGRSGLRTLVVDGHASPGQGENKHAIGGIRATHSDAAKILTCLRSLRIFSTWKEACGEDIEWQQGGYVYPVYRESDADLLTGMMPRQRRQGLDIDFLAAEQIQELIPGIEPRNLLGGTFSQKDGSASPLLAINAFYRQARSVGVRFKFKETVRKLLVENGAIVGVATDTARYEAPVVVDAAGPFSPDLCRTAGVAIPVIPDSHEGAVSEPVRMFSPCMIVDIRPGPGSLNCYFYQNPHGQVVFCLTPSPAVMGTDKRETSSFLPLVCERMIRLIPRLKHLRVRRVWRGLYPNSPDGKPLLGWNGTVRGLLHATGMCGQGFMMGPGVGEIVGRLVTHRSTETDGRILEQFSPERDFGLKETLA